MSEELETQKDQLAVKLNQAFNQRVQQLITSDPQCNFIRGKLEGLTALSTNGEEGAMDLESKDDSILDLTLNQ